jgi:hypothetical protein
MPLRSPWRGRGQGEGEYDCGFHSIFFIGMVAYLPLVLPLSDEVILPFLPTPRRFCAFEFPIVLGLFVASFCQLIEHLSEALRGIFCPLIRAG